MLFLSFKYHIFVDSNVLLFFEGTNTCPIGQFVDLQMASKHSFNELSIESDVEAISVTLCRIDHNDTF